MSAQFFKICIINLDLFVDEPYLSSGLSVT